MQQEIAQDWWEAVFPDQTMPDIKVAGYTTRENHDEVVADCMQERRPPGATYFIQSTAEGWTVTGEYPPEELERSVWICSAQHPLDPAGDHGLLSYAQLEYAYAWLAQRSVPCLQQHGYSVTLVPSWQAFAQPDQGIANWSPYWNIAYGGPYSAPDPPEPNVERVAAALAACPPPPVGTNWAPLFG